MRLAWQQHEDQALDTDKLLSTERRHEVGPATELRRPSRAASLQKRNQITMMMMMMDAKQNITRNQQHITINQQSNNKSYKQRRKTQHTRTTAPRITNTTTRLRRLSALRGGRPAEVSRGTQTQTKPPFPSFRNRVARTAYGSFLRSSCCRAMRVRTGQG